jgi:hypothetical protein
MVNVGIFYGHLEYFMGIWYNLWPFGIVCGHLLFFSQFGMLGPRKIWQPCLGAEKPLKPLLRFHIVWHKNNFLGFHDTSRSELRYAQIKRRHFAIS